MNGNRPKGRQWTLLARGIPLAGLLVLSACSSSTHRETPQVSAPVAGTLNGVATSGPVVPETSKSPDPDKSRKPVSSAQNGLVVRSIYFSVDDATLSEESTKILRQQAEYLRQNPKRVIVLRAYLDSFGSRTFSLALVQKRLNVVAEMLHEQGVAKSRIRQVLLGRRGKKPSCETSACQDRGQRIELLYK